VLNNGLTGLLCNDTHVGSVCGVRNPLGGCAWGGLFQHAVDLLEGETLGLGDEDVRVDDAAEAEAVPEPEDLGTEVGISVGSADEVGSDNGDDAVPHPVGGSGETDTTGTDGKGEDLADKNPGSGTPGGGEEEDVDADEGDHGADSFVVGGVDGSDNGADELANTHTNSTPDQDRTTAELLNDIEGDRSGADVDEGGDKRDQKGVGDRSQRLEEDGTEVEDEVNSSPLLHHL